MDAAQMPRFADGRLILPSYEELLREKMRISSGS